MAPHRTSPVGRIPTPEIRRHRQVEALLQKERVDLLVQLERWPGGWIPSHPQLHDPAEVAADLYDQEETVSVKVIVLQRLAEVDAALQRLAKGTYGRCEVCGMPIPHARLAALPTARLRVECQQQLEQDPSQPPRPGC